MTSLDTTNHTNATVYNSKNEKISTITQEIIDGDQEESLLSTRKNINDYIDYKIGKLSPPPVIGSYTNITNRDQLGYRLSVDCAMVIGSSITRLEEPLTHH